MGVNDFIKIGNKIKEIRKQKGISQKEMAKKLSIPRSTYSNYENNNREPNVETLNKIAKALNIEIWKLLGISEQEARNKAFTYKEFGDFAINKSEKEEGELLLKHLEIELLKKFNILNSIGKKEAIKRIEELGCIDKYME